MLNSHAGPAAAGLTLTMASNIILMEPFLSPGELQQALTRCHRIGQTSRVKARTYFSSDSVEERLVAIGKASEGAESNGSGLEVLSAEDKSLTHEKICEALGLVESR